MINLSRLYSLGVELVFSDRGLFDLLSGLCFIGLVLGQHFFGLLIGLLIGLFFGLLGFFGCFSCGLDLGIFFHLDVFFDILDICGLGLGILLHLDVFILLDLGLLIVGIGIVDHLVFNLVHLVFNRVHLFFNRVHLFFNLHLDLLLDFRRLVELLSLDFGRLLELLSLDFGRVVDL